MGWHAGMALDALAKCVPRDAYGLMAVTMCDLYPRPEWNFVYGLARLTERVGIFSFVRHTPDVGIFGSRPEAWMGAYLLYRSLKTLLHEIGHMFGLKHCTWYNCLMRGSNGEGVEHQANHLYLCPVCLRKLHWNIGFDIREQYAGLLGIFQEYAGVSHDFAHDCAFFQRRLAKLEALPDGCTIISEVPSMLDRRAPGIAEHSKRASLREVPSEVRRPRASSTSALKNRSSRASRPIFAQNASRIVRGTESECDCCDPREKNTASLRTNFDANRAAKLLEDINSSLPKDRPRSKG